MSPIDRTLRVDPCSSFNIQFKSCASCFFLATVTSPLRGVLSSTALRECINTHLFLHLQPPSELVMRASRWVPKMTRGLCLALPPLVMVAYSLLTFLTDWCFWVLSLFEFLLVSSKGTRIFCCSLFLFGVRFCLKLHSSPGEHGWTFRGPLSTISICSFFACTLSIAFKIS